jgi:hypothetical protein
MATATAITAYTALRIERKEMVRVMHEEHSFSDLFLKFLLARSMRTQADLIDQLFNSSEKRLARILLLLAEFGKPGEPELLIPAITQETLAAGCAKLGLSPSASPSRNSIHGSVGSRERRRIQAAMKRELMLPPSVETLERSSEEYQDLRSKRPALMIGVLLLMVAAIAALAWCVPVAL